MNAETIAKLIESTNEQIRRANASEGWYGGVSGTEFYNRDWKKDRAQLKRLLKTYEKMLKAAK